MENNPPQDKRLWAEKAVAAWLGVSRPSVRALGKRDPDFPRPIRLSARAVKYDRQALEGWLASKSKPQKPPGDL